MLSRGVHLFHGSGFLSAAHGEREVDQTASAFAATLKELQHEGLL
jgi:glutamate-1-semialdehyde aminotransferase